MRETFPALLRSVGPEIGTTDNICTSTEKIFFFFKNQTLEFSDSRTVKFLNLQSDNAESTTEMRHLRSRCFGRMSGPHFKETGKWGSCESQEKEGETSLVSINCQFCCCCSAFQATISWAYLALISCLFSFITLEPTISLWLDNSLSKLSDSYFITHSRTCRQKPDLFHHFHHAVCVSDMLLLLPAGAIGSPFLLSLNPHYHSR